MTNGENEITQHQIPVSMAGRIGEVFRDVQEATIDISSYLIPDQPNVTIPTAPLRRLVEGIDEISRTIRIQETRSLASLYLGSFLGVILGVLGNFFVSFWFQGHTLWNIIGLVTSGILLFIVSLVLLWLVKRYRS